MDTKKISAEELESSTLFMTKVSDSITFKGGDLSKMAIRSLLANSSTLKFEGTTLPYNMSKSSIKNLILNNVTFPKDEIIKYITEDGEADYQYLVGMIPNIKNSLEIYGYVKNSPLNGLTEKQLENVFPELAANGAKSMPYSYKGPEDIYNRLKKYFYKGESTKTEFGNFPISSLNKKPQSPVLLALLQGKANYTRG